MKLDCQHIFHLDCLLSILKKKWPGPRIVFNYLDCLMCKKRIRAAYCQELSQILMEAEHYEKDVIKKALERGKHEGLDKEENMKKPNYAFYGKF